MVLWENDIFFSLLRCNIVSILSTDLKYVIINLGVYWEGRAHSEEFATGS